MAPRYHMSTNSTALASLCQSIESLALEAALRDLNDPAEFQSLVPLFAEVRKQAQQAGLPDAAVFFDDPQSAGDYLRTIARKGDAILFKGSRGTRVEQALERFTG